MPQEATGWHRSDLSTKVDGLSTEKDNRLKRLNLNIQKSGDLDRNRCSN